MRSLNFAKGHGTGNDFVIVVDRTSLTPISPDDVAWLCDRHFGLGGDGLLRVVWAGHADDWSGDPEMWFMDYRNADGSVAEMCGNGLRVFARFLVDEGLVPNEAFPVATRAGVRTCVPHRDGSVTVEIGPATIVTGRTDLTVTLADRTWPAVQVDVGNPHAVVLLDDHDDLTALPVHLPPSWDPVEAFPQGTNVEFVHDRGGRSLALRVHERGSGETLSCGTGIAAAVAVAASAADGQAPAGECRYEVIVPGGRLVVDLAGDSTRLTGPAEIVARGQVYLPDAGSSSSGGSRP